MSPKPMKQKRSNDGSAAEVPQELAVPPQIAEMQQQLGDLVEKMNALTVSVDHVKGKLETLPEVGALVEKINALTVSVDHVKDKLGPVPEKLGTVLEAVAKVSDEADFNKSHAALSNIKQNLKALFEYLNSDE